MSMEKLLLLLTFFTGKITYAQVGVARRAKSFNPIGNNVFQ